MRILCLYFIFVFLGATAVAQQQTPAGKFDDVFEKEFYSDILGENRLLYIHIPDKKGNYPVIYLLDAQSSELFGEALQASRNIEKVGPHIVVGIVTSGSRNRDMIPAVVEDRSGSGEAAQFLDFLTGELQPYVDRKFKTNGTNILFGASNAGLFTLYAMLEKPEFFQGYISSSTMVGHCKPFMEEKALQLDPERLEGRYLYMNYGSKGEYDRARDYIPGFHDLLTARFGQELHSRVQVMQAGGHVPSGSIAAGLDYFYSTLGMD